jgi:general stress protein 26
MLTAEQRVFLEKPLIARLSTLDHEGYPHTVPLWFLLDGEDIVIISDRATRKVMNALVNPKGAVCIGGEPGDGAGYLIRGDLTVSDDVDQRFTHQMIDKYEAPVEAARLKALWRDDDIVVLRLKPKSVVRVWG